MLFSLRNKYVIYWVVSVAALSGLLFGFDTGIISGAILFINQELQLTIFDNSLLTSAALFGACIGAAVSGRVVDKCGRRHLLIFNSFLFLCGSLFGVFAFTFQTMVIGRTIVGFAVGVSSYVAPIYISEMAPFQKRGIMVGFNQLFIVIGILISYMITYWFSFGEHWRVMFGFGAGLAVLLFIGLLFVPNSPRWLLAVGKEQEARDVLAMVRAPHNDVELELFEIKHNLNEERRDWKIIFKPWLLPAVIVGFGLAIFQQLVGINIFVYYGSTIFSFAGFDGVSRALFVSLGMGVVLLVFTLIGLPLIDKWGRRPLLLLGAAGMSMALLLLSFVFWFVPKEMYIFKQLLVLGVFSYIASFAFSLGPIGWLMMSEVFPLRIRGLATSLATATIWGTNMAVVFTFLPLVKLLHFKGILLLYSGMCILSVVFVYFFVPETKGVTLEHIEANLRSGKRSRNLGE